MKVAHGAGDPLSHERLPLRTLRKWAQEIFVDDMSAPRSLDALLAKVELAPERIR